MNDAFMLNHAGTRRCSSSVVAAFTAADVLSDVENSVKRGTVAYHR